MTDEQPAPAADQTPVAENSDLHDKVVEAIKTCYDPEVPVNILAFNFGKSKNQ